MLKYFQTVQIMFGFLQKHHNSQLQNETSATAVSVVLVECHKMLCPFTIVPRRNRLVHRRYLVKSKLCNVTDLSALYQVGFSQQPSGKAATSWALNMSVSPKVVLSTNFFSILGGKNRRLPDEDCYSHQLKLLPAGPLNISVSPKVVLSTNLCSILKGKKPDAFPMKTATAIR